MKKLMRSLLAAAMMLSLAACSSKTETSAGVSGEFEGTAQGFHAPVTVKVTLADGAITDVTVVEHSESAGVSDYAIATMPSRIVESQSFNVDVCTGATFSSMAVKNAVKDALKTAGIEGFDAKVRMTAEDETIDTDVAIVGGGIAGMAAAIEAAEAGANVVILEKLDRIGGSTITSGGYVVSLASEMNKELNSEDSIEEWVNYYVTRGHGNVDADMLKFWGENSSATGNWLIEKAKVPFTSVVKSGTSPRLRALLTSNGGADIMNPIYDLLTTYDNITLIRHATVTDVLTKDGAAAGVVADHYGATLTVNAKAVVIAAGGYDADDAMRAKYSPESAESACMSSCGNTGDWIAWGDELGAQMLFKGGVMGMHSTNPAYTLTGGINLYSFLGTLGVNAKGERFQNESNDYPIYDTNMKKDGSDHFWHLYTTELLDAFGGPAVVESALGTGLAFKADSLEELAEATGMDAETLKATVARYNELAAKGEDEDFGVANMMPIATENSYYAVKTVKATVASFGGFVSNEKSEMLNADGEAIPGFFVAGECANASFLEMEYPASGTMISIATTFGLIAGQNAAAVALG